MAGHPRGSVLLLGLVLTACSSVGDPDPVAVGGPLRVEAAAFGADLSVLAARPEAPGAETPEGPLLPRGADVLAFPLERLIRVWEEPRPGDPDFLFDTRNATGARAPLLVAGARRVDGEAWYEVYLPIRPNGRSVWLRPDEVRLREHEHRIEVDLSERRLRYLVDGEVVERISVGVGTASTPTATGTFYVWVKVPYPNTHPAYGIMALGLSGFSEVLKDWPGGGRMAVHGTANPGDRGRSVSHGCVRVYNQDMEALVDVPLGTPVVITR